MEEVYLNQQACDFKVTKVTLLGTSRQKNQKNQKNQMTNNFGSSGCSNYLQFTVNYKVEKILKGSLDLIKEAYT